MTTLGYLSLKERIRHGVLFLFIVGILSIYPYSINNHRNNDQSATMKNGPFILPEDSNPRLAQVPIAQPVYIKATLYTIYII